MGAQELVVVFGQAEEDVCCNQLEVPFSVWEGWGWVGVWGCGWVWVWVWWVGGWVVWRGDWVHAHKHKKRTV